jgi:hypothetical protein
MPSSLQLDPLPERRFFVTRSLSGSRMVWTTPTVLKSMARHATGYLTLSVLGSTTSPSHFIMALGPLQMLWRHPLLTEKGMHPTEGLDCLCTLAR